MGLKDTALYQAVRKKYYIMKNPVHRKVYRSMKKFKNIHKGERCFIIGNGPSLKIEDLEKIKAKGFKTFACNRIYLAYEQTDWRPDYYFMADLRLIESDGMSPKLDVPIDHRFFPDAAINNVSGGSFYHTLYYRYKQDSKFSKDASEGVYQSGTVTTDMLHIAYYMGFSEFYLIGVDFNYHMGNKSADGNSYVYNNENNYFIKGYFKKGEVANTNDPATNLLGYEAARRAIEEEGRKVFNATRGGKLEVFERIDIDELLNTKLK